MAKFLEKKVDNMFSKMFKKKHEETSTINNYIPIDYIKDSVFKLRSGRDYRCILKVNPVDFFTKSEDEKDAIIGAFEVFLNSLKYSVQIVTQSKKINIKNNLNHLKECYNSCDNEYLKEYIGLYASHLYNIIQNNSVLNKNFYLVVEYSASESEAFLDVRKNLTFNTNRISASLRGCGLTSSLLNDSQLYKLFYLFYNKDKDKMQGIDDVNIEDYLTIAAINPDKYMDKRNIFDKPKEEGFDISKLGNTGLDKDIRNYKKDDVDISDNLIYKGTINVQDIIASDQITIERDYMIINNRYLRSIFISGISAQAVHGQWLSSIYLFPADVDISMHIIPFQNKDAINGLNRSITYEISSAMESNKEGKLLNKTTERNINEIEYMRDALTYGQKMFQISFYLTLSAESLNELDDLTMEIESELANKEVLTRRASLTQMEAFTSVLPIGLDSIGYYRNIISEPLSAFFPFVSSELSCEKGYPILYGINEVTYSLVAFDKFFPPDETITNYNTIICGTIGSGKSFTAKLEIMRKTGQGTKIIGIDPNGEYGPVCKRIGGQYLNISTSSKQKINIFDISPYVDENGAIPDLLKDKIANLHLIFSTMFEVLNEVYTSKIQNLMDSALVKCYKNKGITSNAATLFKDNKFRTGNSYLVRKYLKEPPTLSDLKKVLLSDYGEAGRVIVEDFLDIFIDGAYNIFNGQTSVDMDSNALFFSIRDINKKIKPLVYLILCEFIWEKVKIKPRNEHLEFLVDECWILMKSRYTAEFLSEFARQDRKFNVSLCCVTQRAKDFYMDPWGYGQVIYGNSAMHILMQQNKDDIGVIMETYKLTENMKMDLLTVERGHGYIFWGKSFTKIYFSASEDEFFVINTDPNIQQTKR